MQRGEPRPVDAVGRFLSEAVAGDRGAFQRRPLRRAFRIGGAIGGRKLAKRRRHLGEALGAQAFDARRVILVFHAADRTGDHQARQAFGVRKRIIDRNAAAGRGPREMEFLHIEKIHQRVQIGRASCRERVSKQV